MRQRVTIKDIATTCGVSPSTVSLALNRNPRVNEETRRKVLAAAEAAHYVPNVNARGLVSRSSRILSVTVPPLSHVFADIYFGEIISGFYDQAFSEGYKVLLELAQTDYIAHREHLNILRTGRVDGSAFVATSTTDAYLRDFEGANMPVLLVNHYFPGSRLNYISVDYNHCARTAVRHLADLGHRRLGLIIGTNTHTGLDFRDSFVEQGSECGLSLDSLPWTARTWDERGGYEGAEWLMQRHPGLTAIVAGNDRMAIGAMRYLLSRSIRVPEQVSIIGMDNIEAAKFTTPRLTTIELNLYQIGVMSCKRLLELVRRERESVQEFLPSSLILRESTGSAPH